MDKNLFKFRLIGILLFLAMIAGFSVAAMLLWNWLMPDIFGLPVLNYWQSLGLAVLSRIFFGGFGGFDRGHFRHGGDPRLFHHGNKLREKWMNMSEEERNEFIKKEKEFSHFYAKFDHLRRQSSFFDGDERGGKEERYRGQSQDPQRGDTPSKEGDDA